MAGLIHVQRLKTRLDRDPALFRLRAVLASGKSARDPPAFEQVDMSERGVEFGMAASYADAATTSIMRPQDWR
jgi:hypothetical protein